MMTPIIIDWKRGIGIKVDDVTDTLDLALTASGCSKVEHRLRLLSDNGPCYVAVDLGEWLKKTGSIRSPALPPIRRRNAMSNDGTRR